MDQESGNYLCSQERGTDRVEYRVDELKSAF